MTLPDARLTLMRDGLADAALEGKVRAERFVQPYPMQATAPISAVRAAPEPDAMQVSQLQFGERFSVLTDVGDFAFGQCARDGYVGYVSLDALSAPWMAPTHFVCAIRTYAFAMPDIKAPINGLFSLNSLVRITERQGRFARDPRGGWFVESHLAEIGTWSADWVSVAQQFVGAPYQWGGRESLGLDCSGLIQASLFACGRACPRDSDQQRMLGQAVSAEQRERGDLVYWPGHIGVLLDSQTLIHANAHHMAVAIEPLDDAIRRIAAAGIGDPLGYRRPGQGPAMSG